EAPLESALGDLSESVARRRHPALLDRFGGELRATVLDRARVVLEDETGPICGWGIGDLDRHANFERRSFLRPRRDGGDVDIEDAKGWSGHPCLREARGPAEGEEECEDHREPPARRREPTSAARTRKEVG